MSLCPKLGAVPGITSDELKIKATAAGVVYLTQGRFRTRYTGSKKCAVDINGKLYLEKKKLEKLIREGSKNCKKKSRRLPSDREKISPMPDKDTNTISTPEGKLSPEMPDLSTKQAKIPSYSVNKKEVRSRITGYLNSQSGKKELYFWTVTFPMGTPDNLTYQMFNIWLTQLRKYKMLKEYLWVAERQPLKTKTIHFHLCIPHRMDVQRANSFMKQTLKTFARRGEIVYTDMQCYKYNGVDIAKDRTTKRVINFALRKKAKALAGYLTKYVTKNDEKFTHLAWHNSRGYSCIFTGVTFTIKEFIDKGFSWYMDRKNTKVLEFAVFIPWREGLPPPVQDHLFKLNSYIQSQLN